MIIKYLVFATLMLCCITSSDPYFGTDLSWRKIPPAQKDDVTELAWMSTDSFKTYLMDEDNRVSNKFAVTKYYYPTVNFWFLVYTQFDSSNVVIHDKSNLSLIYKVLDFSSLHEKKLNKNILYVLQQKISNERINKIKNDLKDLSRDPFSLSHDAKSIYRTLKEAGIALPIKKLDRQAFFNKLKDNIRTQTGQRNFIKDGIIRSLPYKTFLNKYFAEHKLPPELLAVPFLESSFNPKAESRVGAMGTWQFMPLIASYYVPKKSLSPQYDYRSNVGVISVAAAYLMKENFQLMKSWDMAVTAYNSGTKHLLKTKRELASTKKDVNLEAVIKHSDSQHFGFASKNFYSEFLALVHALAYEE
jgi:membrane-bound lytic murein transglycosylase D